MKKHVRKLNLNKRTISNLNTVEMNQKVGGATNGQHCTGFCDSERRCTNGCHTVIFCGPTQHGHTCNGGNNC